MSSETLRSPFASGARAKPSPSSAHGVLPLWIGRWSDTGTTWRRSSTNIGWLVLGFAAQDCPLCFARRLSVQLPVWSTSWWPRHSAPYLLGKSLMLDLEGPRFQTPWPDYGSECVLHAMLCDMSQDTAHTHTPSMILGSIMYILSISVIAVSSLYSSSCQHHHVALQATYGSQLQRTATVSR